MSSQIISALHYLGSLQELKTLINSLLPNKSKMNLGTNTILTVSRFSTEITEQRTNWPTLNISAKDRISLSESKSSPSATRFSTSVYGLKSFQFVGHRSSLRLSKVVTDVENWVLNNIIKTDFDKFNLVNYDYGGLNLSLSQFGPLPKLPQKMILTSKVVKRDTK